MKRKSAASLFVALAVLLAVGAFGFVHKRKGHPLGGSSLTYPCGVALPTPDGGPNACGAQGDFCGEWVFTEIGANTKQRSCVVTDAGPDAAPDAATHCSGGHVLASRTAGCCYANQVGSAVCNGVCTNLMTDPQNCGKCGTTCNVQIGYFCSNGTCGL
jgi:hypothetical protein